MWGCCVYLSGGEHLSYATGGTGGWLMEVEYYCWKTSIALAWLLSFYGGVENWFAVVPNSMCCFVSLATKLASSIKVNETRLDAAVLVGLRCEWASRRNRTLAPAKRWVFSLWEGGGWNNVLLVKPRDLTALAKTRHTAGKHRALLPVPAMPLCLITAYRLLFQQ